MLFESLTVTRFEQNCSILWCEATRSAAVIDPGGDLWRIQNMVELLELEVQVVLLTHGHFDHCGEAATFADAVGAPIEGPHIGDQHLIAQLSSDRRPILPIVDLYGQETSEGDRQAGKTPSTRAIRSFVPKRWLEHGDEIRFGDETLRVIHCPGHTAGHVTYFSETARVAFVGDTLFRNAIGSWTHADGDLPTLIASIRNRLFVLGDDVNFLPGHGGMSSFGQERRTNPFVGDVAYARWAKAASAGRTPDAISDAARG